MKINLFILLLVLVSFTAYSQDCNSLRKNGESYGTGDNAISWCDFETQTAYVKCMCDRESNYQNQITEGKRIGEKYNSDVANLRKQEDNAVASGNYRLAIDYLNQHINLVKQNPINDPQWAVDRKLITLRAQRKQYESSLNDNSNSQNDGDKEIKIDISNDKTVSKNNQSRNAKDFIDKQNEQFTKQQELNQKLADDLTQTFNQISDSWAKERDFQSKISSLTNINSVDASSIISEARTKAQQINREYASRKQDALNQGVSATQNLVNSAQNEKQAIAGGILGAGLTALSQSNLEKERKKAQEKLENEKQQVLKKLSQKIIDKFAPIKIQHEQAAIYAVKKDNEDYHLSQYEYAKCMTDNAYKIVVDDYTCEKTKISKPILKSKKALSGQDYFNAYKRKKKSTIPELKQKAEYFLELAINKAPKNTKYLIEKLNNFDLNVFQQLAIMKKCLALDPKNLTLDKRYKKQLRLFTNLKVDLGFYSDNLNNINKVSEKKLKSLDNGFEDVKFIKKNLFVVSKYSGKILKVKNHNSAFIRDKVKEKLYGLVDSLGQVIAPIKYKEIGDFSEGKASVLIKKKYGFINEKGEIVIPFKFKYEPSEFKNGYSIINKLDKVWKLMFGEEKTFKIFIDSTGKELNGKKYDELNHFSEGLAFSGKSKLTSYEQNFIDKDGNIVIPLDKYYIVRSFSEGMAAVQFKSKNTKDQSIQKWGFINNSGKEIIGLEYDIASSFLNGYAIVGKNGKRGIIDKQNNVIIPFIYDDIYSFNNGYSIAHLNGKTGIINKQNEVIIPFLYDIHGYNDFGTIIPNHIFLKKNNKWGIVNEKGEVAMQFKYNKPEHILIELMNNK